MNDIQTFMNRSEYYTEEQVTKNQKNFIKMSEKIKRFKELYRILFKEYTEKPLLMMFVVAFKVEETHRMFMAFY